MTEIESNFGLKSMLESSKSICFLVKNSSLSNFSSGFKGISFCGFATFISYFLLLSALINRSFLGVDLVVFIDFVAELKA